MQATSFEDFDFTAPMENSELTAPRQLSALLQEALGNQPANRGRFCVSADELGIDRRSIAVRLSPNLTGQSGNLVLHNVNVVGKVDYATEVWDERDRSGRWVPMTRHTEILVEYMDDDGVFHQEDFHGVVAMSIDQAASHFDEVTP